MIIASLRWATYLSQWRLYVPGFFFPCYCRYFTWLSFQSLKRQNLYSFLWNFLSDAPDFYCQADNETLHSACPDNQVANCERIKFDESFWTANLASELRLVCDRSEYRALPNYGWFAGFCLTSATLQLGVFAERVFEFVCKTL